MTDSQLPLGRYSPAKGIVIDRTAKEFKIIGIMELYGPEASKARAQSIEHSINQSWTQSFSDGYKVQCNIRVRYRVEGTSAGEASQIEAVNISGPSHVNMRNREMTLNARHQDAFKWTAAHEFGHVIGLYDRYSEGIISKIKAKIGLKRTTEVHDGYEKNIMAVHKGVLESRNLGNLVDENAPGWTERDDRVRYWINHHEMGEIQNISNGIKTVMIKTLMRGWVSDADIKAIIRICSSVQTLKEASKIRSALNLNDFDNLDRQRMRVKDALSAMPQ